MKKIRISVVSVFVHFPSKFQPSLLLITPADAVPV